MFSLPLLTGNVRLRRTTTGQTQVFDPIRKRWVSYTPEEAVRQNFIAFCLAEMHYPAARFAVEKGVKAQGIAARFDAVIFNEEYQPWMLVECKAPDVPISSDTLFQLLRYHQALGCRYWVLYNGVSCFCADADAPESVKWLSGLPPLQEAR